MHSRSGWNRSRRRNASRRRASRTASPIARDRSVRTHRPHITAAAAIQTTRPASRAGRADMWILRSAKETDEPLAFRIGAGAIKTVGRAPRADFILDAALVSRIHCRLTAIADGYHVFVE